MVKARSQAVKTVKTVKWFMETVSFATRMELNKNIVDVPSEELTPEG